MISLLDFPGERVEVRDGETLLTCYVYGSQWSKPYLYPVNGLYSQSLTSNGPKDHPHHRSLWVAHGDVNGVDCWSEAPTSGNIDHKGFSRLSSGREFADVTAKNLWRTRDGHPVLDELREMRFWKPVEEGWVMDFQITFQASYGRTIFADTKEAGILSIRVTPSMEVHNGGRLQNALGMVNEAELWGKRALWCDYSGMVGLSKLGIAIFDHPENPRHPTYWHARDYGIMTANCFGVSVFENDPKKDGRLILEHNDTIRFQYRVFLHRGDVREAKVAEKYEEYIRG